MHGMKLVVSDAHEGLKAARKSIMPGVAWQRCQFHLMQNAMQHIPKIETRKQVAKDLRSIFNAKNLEDANEELKRFVELYQDSTPKLAVWAENNIPEGLSVFLLPEEHRKRMRTTNMLERQNRGLKRRPASQPCSPPCCDLSPPFSLNSVTSGKPE